MPELQRGAEKVSAVGRAWLGGLALGGWSVERGPHGNRGAAAFTDGGRA